MDRRPQILPPLLMPLLLLPLLGGCDDEVCGPTADSQASTATTIGDVDVVWGEWQSSPNNDCGEAGGPTSLTVDAKQEGSSFALTLCLPRPDKLSASATDITDDSRVRIIDIFADVGGGCMASLDRSRQPSGTIGFPGLCGDGDGPDGYSLDLSFTAPMTVVCDGLDPSAAEMPLSGSVSVEAIQF